MNLTAREAALLCAAFNIAETVDDLNAIAPLYEHICQLGTSLTEPQGDNPHYRVFYDMVTEFTGELQTMWRDAANTQDAEQ